MGLLSSAIFATNQKVAAQCDTPNVTISIDTGILCAGELTGWLTANVVVGPSPFLISELDRNTPDFIEITNVSGGPVNATGYKVATSDSYTAINTANSLTWNLTGTWPDSAVQYREDATGNNYWGNNLFYNGTSPGWVIILDPNNNVVDALFWGWTPTDIATFGPTIGGTTIQLGNNWTGNGCPACANSHQRASNIDNDTLTDFGCNTATKGNHNMTITPNSFVPNLSYLWSTGDTTKTIGNVGAGTYWVTVTNNSGGCSRTDTIALNEPDTLTVGFTKNDIKCNGDSIGAIICTATGGKPGYSYQWSNGKSNAIINLLKAGWYSVVVTDKNGCMSEDSVEILQPDAIATSGTTSDEFTGNDGEIDVTVSGGVSPYTYLWSPGGETTEDLTGLSAGTYTVEVKDSNNCVDSASFTLQSFVGITESQFGQISIYPNPSQGELTLEFEKDITAIIEVRNVSGSIVHEERLSSQKRANIVLPSSLEDGLYLLRIIQGDKISEHQLVLRKE